jgi:hypothetical protein
MLLMFLIFMLGYNVSMICVPCCDVRDDFLIKRMFGSSLPQVVCRGGGSLIYAMCVCLRILLSDTYCVVFFLV